MKLSFWASDATFKITLKTPIEAILSLCTHVHPPSEKKSGEEGGRLYTGYAIL